MIERVDVLRLRHRLSRTRFFSTGSNVTRDSVVVRVADRDGTAGWGETYLVRDAVEAASAMGERLVGSRAEDAAASLAEDPPGHRWALGAVSMAVDDLRARQRGVTLGELYGPRVRDRVRAYASSTGYVAGVGLADAWSVEADAVAAAGFRDLKLRIGRLPLAHELPAIQRVSSDHVDLGWMADGNGAYDMTDALRLGSALQELGFRWLEEPLPTSQPAAYAPLARALDLPIAGGESLESPEAASRALGTGAYDIIQPDASICGGIGPLLAIAACARQQGIACIPHACNGAISLAATLQVLAVLPQVAGQPEWSEPMLEHDVGENPLRTDLLRQPLHVDEGWMTIPDGPGLGVDVDEAVLARYRD